MIKKKNLIGGSPASLYVMSVSSPQAAHDVQYMQPNDICLTTQDIVNNYGNVYKTTGGGKVSSQSAVDSIRMLLQRIIDNRVFDIYLKYMGIKTLTPATLVPFALILGKEQFTKIVKYYKDHDVNIQSGGGNVDIPIIDHVLIGNILKLTGLTKLNFTPSTLIPLGLVMIIYDLLMTKKDIKVTSTGNVEVPKKYFKFISPVKQSGGFPSYHYSSVPPNLVQHGLMEWHGQSSNLTESGRGNVYQNSELQLNSGNNDYVDVSNITTGNDGTGTINQFNPTIGFVQATSVGKPLHTIPDSGIESQYGHPTSDSWNNENIWPSPGMGDAIGADVYTPIPKVMAGGYSKKKKKE